MSRPCDVPGCHHLDPCPQHGASPDPSPTADLHRARRPGRICSVRGCSELQPCPIHGAEARRLPSAAMRGYDRRWREYAAAYRRRFPTCVECQRPSQVVDHIRPITGPDDPGFWDEDNHQPLCRSCHGKKTEGEGRTAEWRVGRPRDTRPDGLGPSRSPLTIIHGPPGAGKSTYVAERATPEDWVIDLDELMSEVSGQPWYRAGPQWLARALDRRDELLRSLPSVSVPHVWFIVGAPTREERAWWCRMLRPAEVVVLDVPANECKRRIRGDARRPASQRRRHELAVDQWWRQYEAPTALPVALPEDDLGRPVPAKPATTQPATPRRWFFA